jgi:hypothetical protein
VIGNADRASGERPVREIGEAFSERERADSEVRRSITRVLLAPDNSDLRDEANVALIRERVTRVRYAAALKAAGWFVPEELVADLPGAPGM